MIDKYVGPVSWPFFGNVSLVRQLSQKHGGQHMALLELCKLYKSPVISLRLGKNNTMVVSGSEAIAEVLNGEEYSGRPWNYFIKMRNMGKKKGKV